jgi:GNAT superfamily N-acetyltransferase
MNFSIRLAEPADVEAIVQLIKDLATYERASEEAIASPEQIHEALFSSTPVASCHVGVVNGEVVAMAFWFLNYSTWLGRPGLYLEDLFVREEYRGSGIGLALMKTLARHCVENNYPRFQWWVLDWNTPSTDFYKSLGAEAMDEWTVYRLSGSALVEFARD